MAQLKVLIIEDEEINIEVLKLMLQELGHQVVGVAMTYSEAIDLLETIKPDIALVDIVLGDEKDGILLAQMISSDYNFPFIYTTSLADEATIEKAKQSRPNGYLVKPFKQEDLYTAMEMAVFNFKRSEELPVPPDESSKDSKDSVFVKDEYKLVRIYFSDIMFVKSEGNYVELHLSDRRQLVRSSLKDFLQELPPDKFFQVHKSFVINIDHVNALSGNLVIVNGTQIPVTRSYKDGLMKHIRTYS